MTLTFTINGINDKQADDLAEQIIIFLRDEAGVLIDDYTVEK